MAVREFEDVAGYGENERATRYQQENERWQEVMFSVKKLHHNGLMTDWGLMSICPILVPIANHCFLTIAKEKLSFLR